MELWFIIPGSAVLYTIVGTVIFTLVPRKTKHDTEAVILVSITWPIWVPFAIVLFILYIFLMLPTYKATNYIRSVFKKSTEASGGPVPRK